MSELQERLVRARTALLLDQPWFGVQALNLKLEACPEIPTFDVDGTRLRYNPQFAETLTERQLVFILAHEVMHCALRHPWRRSSRDPEEWNKACDHAINLALTDAGFPLPFSNLLCDAAYRGWTAEAIYAKQRDDASRNEPPPEPNAPKDDNSGSGSEDDDAGDDSGSGSEDDDAGDKEGNESGSKAGGDGNGTADGSGAGNETSTPGKQPGTPCPTGSVRDAAADSEEPDTMAEEDWQVAAEQAFRAATRAGKLPSCVKEAVRAVQECGADWRALLREFLQQLTPQDYSWARPSRRNTVAGTVLPGYRRDTLGTIAVAIDTSGSISSEMMEQFGRELTTIMQEAQPDRIHVIYCDSRVAHMDTYTAGEPIVVTRWGGGGTAFQPAFDWVQAEQLDPLVLIYLTDLDGDNPTQPDYPVIWATPLWVRADGPFGITVRVS